jgi:glutathione S-transferase
MVQPQGSAERMNMYKINGALGSPYSLKMRAILRYRRLPHLWIHGAATHGIAAAKVKAPVIPVIEYPDGSFHNDSTPMIYDLEARHSDRSIVPTDPARAFLAHVIEDFADEWMTKAMFGYRWLRAVDQEQASRWLAFDAFKGGGLNASLGFAEQFSARQVGRMAMVGCTDENFPLIEASTRAVLGALEAHVVNRHCLFGTRPSLAEFSLYGQISQLAIDPTAAAMMRSDFPYTFRWLSHIDDMSGIEGQWDAPEMPLDPIVHKLLVVIGEVYLPFLIANAKAMLNGEETFTFTAMGHSFTQSVFKYQYKCLGDLRSRYKALQSAAKVLIDPLLDKTGCLGPLSAE